MKTNMREMSKKARFKFSLVELFVVVAIISVLFSLLPAHLRKVMDQQSMIQCKKKLGNIGLSMAMFVNDHDDRFTPGHAPPKNGGDDEQSWDDQLGRGYDGRVMTEQETAFPIGIESDGPYATDAYHCPEDLSVQNAQNEMRFSRRSYALNFFLHQSKLRSAQLPRPEITLLLTERHVERVALSKFGDNNRGWYHSRLGYAHDWWYGMVASVMDRRQNIGGMFLYVDDKLIPGGTNLGFHPEMSVNTLFTDLHVGGVEMWNTPESPARYINPNNTDEDLLPHKRENYWINFYE